MVDSSGNQKGVPINLKKNNADVDGDGLQDGEEVKPDGLVNDEGAVVEEIGIGIGINSDLSITRKPKWVAHPNRVRSDGWGLKNNNELEKGSNPKIREQLTVGLAVGALADSDTGEPLQYADDQVDTGFNPDDRLLSDFVLFSEKVERRQGFEIGKPAWLQEVNTKQGKAYIKVPYSVNAFSTENREIEYTIEHIQPNGNVQMVYKSRDDYISTSQGSNEGFILLETGADLFRAKPLQVGGFRLHAKGIEGTRYDHSGPNKTPTAGFATSKGTVLTETQEVLATTAFIWNAASTAGSGSLIAGPGKRTGSNIIFSTGKNKLIQKVWDVGTGPVEKNIKDEGTVEDTLFVTSAGINSISAFGNEVKETRAEVSAEVYGDFIVSDVQVMVDKHN